MNYPPLIKMSLPKACLVAALVPLLLATHAVGAVISWQTPTDVNLNDPTQVLANGTAFSAGSLYPEYWSGVPLTVNGVTFGPIDNSHATFSVTSGNFQFPSGGTDYGNLLSGGYHINNTTSATSPTVFSGLTSGQTYQFQVWVGYAGTAGAGSRYSSSAPDGATNSTAPFESGTVHLGAISNSPASQFVVGTFLADATTQNFYYFGDGGTGTISAYSLRAIDPVPEPQTWALAALGASAVLFRLRRKQRAE